MVGDNTEVDLVGAAAIGMGTVLIETWGRREWDVKQIRLKHDDSQASYHMRSTYLNAEQIRSSQSIRSLCGDPRKYRRR